LGTLGDGVRQVLFVPYSVLNLNPKERAPAPSQGDAFEVEVSTDVQPGKLAKVIRVVTRSGTAPAPIAQPRPTVLQRAMAKKERQAEAKPAAEAARLKEEAAANRARDLVANARKPAAEQAANLNAEQAAKAAKLEQPAHSALAPAAAAASAAHSTDARKGAEAPQPPSQQLPTPPPAQPRTGSMADLRASHGQPAAAPAARSASPVATESQQASTKVPLAPVIQQTSALALSAGTPVKHSAPALAHASLTPAQSTMTPTATTFRPATMAAPSVTPTPTNGAAQPDPTPTTASNPATTSVKQQYPLLVGDMTVAAILDTGAEANLVVSLPPPEGMRVKLKEPTPGVMYVTADNKPLIVREGSANITVGDHLVLQDSPVLCVKGACEVLMGNDLINNIRDVLEVPSYEVTNTGALKFGNVLTLQPVSAPHQTAPFVIRRIQQDSVLQKTVEIRNPLSAPTPRPFVSVTSAVTSNSACREDFRRATLPLPLMGGLDAHTYCALAAHW
jgi:hypothetical protein